jgi:tetratricopeptide (TPR) repeat protein
MALVVGGAALAAGIFAMSLAKVWRVTPPDVTPVFRISVVDWLQSKMLLRRAQAQAAAGDYRLATYAWRAAIANHPASLEVLRSWVSAAGQAEERVMGDAGLPLREAAWMLRLSGTNMADLERALRLLDRAGQPAEVLRLGGAFQARLSAEASGWMAKAAFDEGNMRLFDQIWSRHAAAFEGEKALSLRREAWKAHWGPPSTAGEGMMRLAAAQADAEWRHLALVLGRRVAAARADLAEQERLLMLEINDGTAGVTEHAELWALVAQRGRRDEARRLASEALSVLKVQSPAQVILVGQVLLSLGMLDEATGFLRGSQVARYRDLPVWLLHAEALYALKRWDEIRGLGLEMATSLGGARHVEVISHAWQAVAEAKLHHREAAMAAARRVQAAPIDDPRLAVHLAEWLDEAGLSDAALALLRTAEASMSNSFLYWSQRFLAAAWTSEVEDMLESSRRALALAPKDPRAANNRAVALILARRSMPEAVQLTFENVARFPANKVYVVNHAIALINNDRLPEARAVLGAVESGPASDRLEANRRLAWVLLVAREGNKAEALERVGTVDRSQLAPLQVAILEELVRKLRRG